MSAALWCAYLLVPVAGWSIFAGVPIGPAGAAALAALVWLRVSAGRVPGVRVAAAALAAKLAAGLLLLPQGFAASYFANDRFAPPVERSTDSRGAGLTRIDGRLAFGAAGQPDLPLHFFNDHTRFNFYQRGEPARAALPFSAVWEGDLWVEEGSPAQEFYLVGAGVAAEIDVDGTTVVRLAAGEAAARATAFHPKGWRHVVVRAAAPPGAGRVFEAGLVEEGARRPLGDGPIYRVRTSRSRMAGDRVVGVASTALDIGLAACLAWFVAARLRSKEGRGFWAMASLAAVAEALWFAWPAAGRVLLQAGGDDPLTYESQARDILLNGPLMLLGAAPGHAEPFYYQPLYAYVLAFLHWLVGEDLFGVFFAQRLLVVATIYALARVAGALLGRRVGLALLPLAVVFLYAVVDRWARELWTETIFVPLVTAWTWGLAAMAAMPAGLTLTVATGVAGGLAVLGRSTLLLAALVAPLLVVCARRRRGLPAAPVVAMGLVMAATAGVATIRNLVAAGQLVPITTSFGINLYLGNTPPDDVPVHGTADHIWYEWFATDDRVRAVVEFARHAPARFAANLGRKLLYVLGFFEPHQKGAGWSPALVATWLLAACGIALSWRREGDVVRSARLLPLAVAAGLLAAVVLVFPSHTRLIVPVYVMLLPYGAVAIAAAAPQRAPIES